MNEAVFKAIGELLKEQQDLTTEQIKKLEDDIFEQITLVKLRKAHLAPQEKTARTRILKRSRK